MKASCEWFISADNQILKQPTLPAIVIDSLGVVRAHVCVCVCVCVCVQGTVFLTCFFKENLKQGQPPALRKKYQSAKRFKLNVA